MYLNVADDFKFGGVVELDVVCSYVIASVIYSGRLGDLVWVCIMRPLEGMPQIGSGDLFMTQTWTIASCRIPLSGEEWVIIIPMSWCGVPDVIVCVDRAGDGVLVVVVGLWYLIFLTA